MNWDRIEGNWKQFKGKAREQWGKLTNDHIDAVNGRREILAGKIQESYGITKDEAERQIKDWQDSLKDASNDAATAARKTGSAG
jgi:uncharacterized protein YjbJ (UPF0337 family)